MDPRRITLRPFNLSDASDVLIWAGDDRVTRHGRWPTLKSLEEATTFIQQVCMPHPWRRSICVDGRSIGFVSVFPAEGDDRFKADMGYAIAFEYWGRGIATAAVKMAVKMVFEDFPAILRLQAMAGIENTASQRVLEKAGFTKEGLLRQFVCIKGKVLDVVIYSFLSTHRFG
ncbi:uncharacterized protein LOC127242711 [Andrographis paniculata]|uniref:uncharacterized protein LOC127242711 n=1 Tax=Andrographis paniculata TaxID=175694 RepID=UPI0021E8DBB8|nr:uncharacterized protein LOC127242711 [Andrographis paniculata]